MCAAFFGDGYDLYTAPADAIAGYWDSGTVGFTLVAGRFSGSRAIQNSATGAWLVKTSTGTTDTIHHIICAFQQTATLTGSTLGMYFQLSDGATNQVCIVFRSDGAILLTSATPAGTVLATYTGAVTATSTWYAFEFEVVINASTGSFAVRKNGNTSNDFSASSLNTRPGTNTQANKLTVGVNAAVNNQLLDDLLWRSDTASVAFAGDLRCFTRMPASDASVAWSRSGAGSLSQSIAGAAPQAISSATIRLAQYTINYPGAINSVTVVTSTTPTNNIKAAIWADNAGTPGAVLWGSASQAIIAGNNVFTVSPAVSVVPGQRVWVGTISDSAATGNFMTGTSAPNGATATGAIATFPQANPVITTPAGPIVSTLAFSLPAGNYALVQEAQQDGANSYVYSSTVSQSDLYGIAAIGSTPSSIVGVTTRGFFQKSDAGTRNVAVQLQSGATNVQSASTALNTTWGWLYRTDLVDPATGSAWTAVGVNNAQIGAVVTA